jgi:hypothetical protein
MNGSVRTVADVTTGVLACATLAGVAVVVTRLLAPTYPFSYSIDSAKRFGAIAVGSAVVFLFAIIVRRAVPHFQLAVTRRLALVVAALAGYEALWFGAVATHFLGDVPLPIAATLAAEIGPIALISVVVWGGRTMNVNTRIALFAVTAVLCVIGVALINPVLLYGVAEQIGWLQQPAQHVSGLHELALARHLAYVVLASLAGLPVAREVQERMK